MELSHNSTNVEKTASRENLPEDKSEDNFQPFDPNLVSSDQLHAMGFPKNAVNNLIKYRDAGGTFTIRTDIQKIYGIGDDLYATIEKFILLPEESPKESTLNNDRPNDLKSSYIPRAKSININQATADELMAIQGIGPVLSERIIKYRDLLGGFYSQDQLKEVYGLKEEVIDTMKSHLIIDSAVVKININTNEIRQLSAHPYINYALARSIINYQKVHGPYQQKTDLKKIKIVSDSLFQKLSPYISVTP